MKPEEILELAKECLIHAESCYQAGAYESAMEWINMAKDYQSKLAIVQTH